MKENISVIAICLAAIIIAFLMTEADKIVARENTKCVTVAAKNSWTAAEAKRACK